MLKPDSLYNEGMKLLMYSRKDADQNMVGWIRSGTEICYYQNTMKKKPSGFYFTLTFTMEFKHDQDDVFFSHCFPYTYTDLCKLMNKTCTIANKDRIRKTTLCKTIAGNDCEMLIITNFYSEPEEIAKRKAIIISARVHPGESNSSFIMHGIIEYLISNEEGAKRLREIFVFKMVPMLNPDGVIIGNYRCSLTGQDLNRQWFSPLSRLFPEIHATKMMIRKTLDSRDILMFVDIHGHSRKKNFFMYGCSNPKSNLDKLKERIFPFMFDKKYESLSFKDCCFVVQKDRESTGRVVLWKEFNVINSFTLEASFCGANQGKYKDMHFTPLQLYECGREFCISLIDFTETDQIKVKQAYQEIEMINQKTGAPSNYVYEEPDDQSDSGEEGKKKKNSIKNKKVSGLKTSAINVNQNNPRASSIPSGNITPSYGKYLIIDENKKNMGQQNSQACLSFNNKNGAQMKRKVTNVKKKGLKENSKSFANNEEVIKFTQNYMASNRMNSSNGRKVDNFYGSTKQK